MLIGRFGDTTGAPYLEGRLAIPRLNVRGSVSFLVDTGADQTALMPDDALRLNVDFNMLGNKALATGVGGESVAFREPALLAFTDPGKYVYFYSIDLWLSEPTENHVGIPSLLGRNVMDRWRMVCDPSKDRLSFTVRFADKTVKL